MPYTDIFVGCNDSLSGVKKLRLSAKKQDGEAITYPLDLIFCSGSTDTLLITNNISNRLIGVNGVYYQYRLILPNFVGFEQEIVEDRKGIVFKKSLSFSIPKITLTTNNQIREFLFGQKEQFGISNIFAYITDLNNQEWLVGFDIPLVLEEFDLQTDYKNGDNSYVFRYVSESYLPAMKVIKV